MKAKISETLYRDYPKRKLRPQDGWTTEEFAWHAILRQIEGKEFPLLEDICGGVEDHCYILADTVDHYGKKQISHVVAVPFKFVTKIDDGLNHEVPIVHNHMQAKVFAEQGYHCVHIRAPWVDGFTAFLPIQSTLRPLS